MQSLLWRGSVIIKLLWSIDTTYRYFGSRCDSGNQPSSFQRTALTRIPMIGRPTCRILVKCKKRILIRYFFSPRSFSRTVRRGDTVKYVQWGTIYFSDPLLTLIWFGEILSETSSHFSAVHDRSANSVWGGGSNGRNFQKISQHGNIGDVMKNLLHINYIYDDITRLSRVNIFCPVQIYFLIFWFSAKRARYILNFNRKYLYLQYLA